METEAVDVASQFKQGRNATNPFDVAVGAGQAAAHLRTGAFTTTLRAGSPAIDSANSGAPGQPDLDVAGQARVDDPATVDTGVGSRTYDDRGAYEYQP